MVDVKDPSRASARDRTVVSKAAAIFDFLSAVQRLKTPAVCSVETYASTGSVMWFDALPAHPAVRLASYGGDTELDHPVLEVDRVPVVPPPDVPVEIRDWLEGSTSDPGSPPALRPVDPEALGEVDDEASRVPEEAFASYLESWKEWAAHERLDGPVRELYAELFSVYGYATEKAEEYELVLGLGLLDWTPSGHDHARRHLVTSAVRMEFDEATGRLGRVSLLA